MDKKNFTLLLGSLLFMPSVLLCMENNPGQEVDAFGFESVISLKQQSINKVSNEVHSKISQYWLSTPKINGLIAGVISSLPPQLRDAVYPNLSLDVFCKVVADYANTFRFTNFSNNNLKEQIQCEAFPRKVKKLFIDTIDESEALSDCLIKDLGAISSGFMTVFPIVCGAFIMRALIEASDIIDRDTQLTMMQTLSKSVCERTEGFLNVDVSDIDRTVDYLRSMLSYSCRAADIIQNVIQHAKGYALLKILNISLFGWIVCKISSLAYRDYTHLPKLKRSLPYKFGGGIVFSIAFAYLLFKHFDLSKKICEEFGVDFGSAGFVNYIDQAIEFKSCIYNQFDKGIGNIGERLELGCNVVEMISFILKFPLRFYDVSSVRQVLINKEIPEIADTLRLYDLKNSIVT